jgi:hypothetical protein
VRTESHRVRADYKIRARTRKETNNKKLINISARTESQ